MDKILEVSELRIEEDGEERLKLSNKKGRNESQAIFSTDTQERNLDG